MAIMMHALCTAVLTCRMLSCPSKRQVTAEHMDMLVCQILSWKRARDSSRKASRKALAEGCC